jgi:hypothetical protein
MVVNVEWKNSKICSNEKDDVECALSRIINFGYF